MQGFDPLTHLSSYYRDEQLRKALSIVLSPGSATGNVQDALRCIKRSEVINRAVPRGRMALYQDEIAHWWASVVSAAAFWMLNQKEDAISCQQIIESKPKFEADNHETMSYAMVTTYESYKISQEEDKQLYEHGDTFAEASEALESATRFLKSEETEPNTPDDILVKVRKHLSLNDHQEGRSK